MGEYFGVWDFKLNPALFLFFSPKLDYSPRFFKQPNDLLHDDWNATIYLTGEDNEYYFSLNFVSSSFLARMVTFVARFTWDLPQQVMKRRWIYENLCWMYHKVLLYCWEER